MNPGILNERIMIQKRNLIKEKGIPKPVWEEFYGCWSGINNLFGNELYQAINVNLENTLNFTVRYCNRLDNLNTKEFRVVWKGRVFNLVYVDYLNMKKEKIILKATEVM
ncbi:phage head closure protein [Clostridium sp. 19966]|uniref:phage head closure protein n=1 Tax=Clostridium sp. 19966 TaxID=2768166 RepID=UPI0028DF7CF1|nr:phage head closure protein [Clostridium sp. 19966]MDT8717607.1 phage head closure protein [Clostridium sp. 19966]